MNELISYVVFEIHEFTHRLKFLIIYRIHALRINVFAQQGSSLQSSWGGEIC